jgi:hypothetical protein
MEDTKVKEFFEGVLLKTRAGRIRWQPTADESEYIAVIGGQFTLSVAQCEIPFPVPHTGHALSLKDQDGRELIRVTGHDEGVDYGEIGELYETARRQALRADDKIEQVLGELSKL